MFSKDVEDKRDVIHLISQDLPLAALSNWRSTSRFFYRELADDLVKRLEKTIQQASALEQVIRKDNGTIILKKNGEVWACGNNKFENGRWGRLGFQDQAYVSVFTQAPELTGVKQVHFSARSTYFLKEDGTVWRTQDNQPMLTQLADVGHVTHICSLTTHSVQVFLRADNTILWRGNRSAHEVAPTILLKKIMAMDITEHELLGLAEDNQLYTIDYNTFKLSIYQPIGQNIIQAVSDQNGLMLCLNNKGKLWVAGHDKYGKLGKPQKYTEPTLIFNNEVVKTICALHRFAIVLTENGYLYANPSGMFIPLLEDKIQQAFKCEDYLFLVLQDNSIKKIKFDDKDIAAWNIKQIKMEDIICDSSYLSNLKQAKMALEEKQSGASEAKNLSARLSSQTK